MKFDICEDSKNKLILTLGDAELTLAEKVKDSLDSYCYEDKYLYQELIFKFENGYKIVLFNSIEPDVLVLHIENEFEENLAREFFDFSHVCLKERIPDKYEKLTNNFGLQIDAGKIGLYKQVSGMPLSHVAMTIFMLAVEYAFEDILNNPKSYTPKTDSLLENFYKDEN